MRIILDSNIYIADFRMQGVAFSTLFDFIRKTKSTLVLPRIVREEVVHQYTERFVAQVRDVAKAWKSFRYLVLYSDPGGFHKPELKYQIRELRKRLRAPAKGIAVEYFQDVPGVDINEVAIRGIKRIPPANAEGEELRDVIIWYQVMSLAKSASEATAFITADTGFWEGQSPRLKIQEDIAAATDLRLYKSIDDFIKANSPRQTTLTNETATHLVPASLFAGDVLPQFVARLKQAANSFGFNYDLFGVYGGHIEVSDFKPLPAKFVDGTIFEIDSDVSFVTATYDYETKATLKLGPALEWSASQIASGFGIAAPVAPFAFFGGGFSAVLPESYQNPLSAISSPNPFYPKPPWSPVHEKIAGMTDSERIKEVIAVGRAAVSARLMKGTVEEKGFESFALKEIRAGDRKLSVNEVIGPRGPWLRVTGGGS